MPAIFYELTEQLLLSCTALKKWIQFVLYLLLLMLFLVEFFKILRDDGDGERHHQHARDGTERPNQLPQS
jgi:hypothetical protein